MPSIPNSNLSTKIKKQVAKRADNLYEYCLANSEYAYHTFPIDHIIPTSIGITNALNNLANIAYSASSDPPIPLLLDPPLDLLWKTYDVKEQNCSNRS